MLLRAPYRFLACLVEISSRTDGLPRGRLLWDFLRINTRFAFGSRRTNDTVLGKTVRFTDYEAFYFVFQEIFIHGTYAFPYRGRAPRIIDCGGSFGMSVLYFKLVYPGSSIVVFEPDEESYALLVKNIKANRLRGVTCVRAAVSDRDGSVRFATDRRHLSRGIIPSGGVRVPSRSLRRYLTGKVDLLKIDIEGAEGVVIPDIAPRLRNITRIILEFHDSSSIGFGRIASMLEDAGLRYCPSRNDSPSPVPPESFVAGFARVAKPRNRKHEVR